MNTANRLVAVLSLVQYAAVNFEWRPEYVVYGSGVGFSSLHR